MMEDVKQFYKDLLDKNGVTPAAVQHRDQKSQYKRFEILSGINSSINSIIDVGCGLGDMCDYLLSTGYKGRYLGLDFLDEFINIVKDKYKANPQANFQLFDLWKEEIPKNYDYVFLSGVFNNRTPRSQEFMMQSIDKMFAACNKGIAFNSMSTYVDYEDDHLYYSDPTEVFDYCKKNLTSSIVLKHDYLLKVGSIPFEYTMYLYKEDV